MTQRSCHFRKTIKLSYKPWPKAPGLFRDDRRRPRHPRRTIKRFRNLAAESAGAASLVLYCAKKMDLPYSIPENAEIISSIGVALSMVRDVVERVIPNPTQDDIRDLSGI